MADKSWGAPTSPAAPGGFRVRTNDTLADRAAARASARADRDRAREAAIAQRLESRAVDRAADIAARERARVDRRDAEVRAAAAASGATPADPHAAAASRRRGSGRKDVVREQRDTRSYTTIVDHGRIRELASRGASVSGLAGAFDLSEAAVRRILDGVDAAVDAVVVNGADG